MYELIQVGTNTYYMDCPSKVGFYRINDEEVVLIDSGSDKDAAKRVKKILDQHQWKLRAIYNTHSHADHIGGNQYLQAQTDCRIYAPETEQAFAEAPVLEPSMLYGGYPLPELQTKFLMAKESVVEKLPESTLPDESAETPLGSCPGLSYISLPGHSYRMAGYRTGDDVVFLADSLSGEATLEKYQIGFLYDVQAYLDTLEKVKTLQAACFVPSHAEAVTEIAPLAQKNIDKTNEIAQRIREMLATPQTFEELLADIFAQYGITMTLQQSVLIGNTIKSYLSFLKAKEQITFRFENNRMLWSAVKPEE